jgi:SdrD B-like domain
VFLDRNSNGLRDAGERGIGGVLVTLTVFDGTVLEAVTDEDCFYTFDGLPAGRFTVAIQSTSTPTNGPNRRNVVLAPGETNLNIDYGYSLAGVQGIQIVAQDQPQGDPVPVDDSQVLGQVERQDRVQDQLAFTGGNALFSAALALILAGLGGLLTFRRVRKNR